MKPQEFIDKWLGWANNKEEINDEILADLDAMNKALSQHDVSGQSELLPLAFIKWYSGMEQEKILKAYERWEKESGNSH